MHTNMNEPDAPRHSGAVRNPELAYDRTDLSARGVVMFMVFLGIGAVLIALSLWGVYKYIVNVRSVAIPDANTQAAKVRELRPVGGDPAAHFPAPRLQPDPVGDLNRFRTQEEQTLNSYGWVDEANGKVHIPIERAMDMIGAVGLPVRPEASAGKE